MLVKYAALWAILGLAFNSCAASDDKMHVPMPLVNHPGNIFVAGESITIPVPENTDWTLIDYDAKEVSKGTAAKEGAVLGSLPVGWYQLSWLDKEENSPASIAVSVLEPLTEPIPASSPIGVDAGMMYLFHGKENSGQGVAYNPEDVANIVALTGVGWIRDRMWWKAYDYLTRTPIEKEAPDLDFEACRAEGLHVLATVYEAPPEYRSPEESGLSLTKKPPYKLDKIYAYFQALAKRYPDTVQEWESWNEPEGIGGTMLSYEIAAVQKAAYLGIKMQAPSVQSGMGLGSINNPEHLNANGYLDFIDTYSFHSHRKIYQELQSQCEKLSQFHGEIPLWLTESSSGSYHGLPGSPGELGLDQAKAQANAIPKLFSRALFFGVKKIFYFYFFSHTEVQGEVFGLVRERDLAPRPGYNALATVGRLLASASRPEKVEGLPDGGEGYQFHTIEHGASTCTALLWNESAAGEFDWNISSGSAVFDTIGRKIIPQDGKIKIGADPVYIVSKDTSLPLAPAAPPEQVLPCPVVMDLILADRYKNDAGDYLAIPCEENFVLPLDIYNFSNNEAIGSITVAFPEVLKIPSRTFSIKLAAGQHLTQRIEVTFPRLQPDSSEPSRIHIEGDFGSLGKSVMALDFKLLIRKLSDQDVATPIADASDGSHWKAVLNAKASMTTRLDGDWTVFDWMFGPAVNSVVHQVWAAPSLPITAEEIPTPYPDGLAIDLRQVGGPRLKMAVNVVEKNNAAYIGLLDLSEADLRSDQGVTAVIPFNGMTNPGYRVKDDNGHLDIGDIRSIEIAAWTEPNSKVTLAFKNLRWVNFKYQDDTATAH